MNSSAEMCFKKLRNFKEEEIFDNFFEG